MYCTQEDRYECIVQCIVLRKTDMSVLCNVLYLPEFAFPLKFDADFLPILNTERSPLLGPVGQEHNTQ